MSETNNWLLHDHRKFEAALQDCELAAGAEDWKAAVALFHGFVDELKLHMRMEDEVIYPFFQREVEDPQDDLGELMYEHDTLARLLNDLARVIRNRDFDHFEESLRPLYRAMTEHNAHEEAVLGRMGSASLLQQRAQILRELESIDPKISRGWEF